MVSSAGLHPETLRRPDTSLLVHKQSALLSAPVAPGAPVVPMPIPADGGLMGQQLNVDLLDCVRPGLLG